MKSTTFRISAQLFERLERHLFPGDGDEHGAVIAAGIAETDAGVRLLGREVFLAKDGIDYVPGQFGYRALTTDFIARAANYCAREKLCYLAVHCHGGSDAVGFSLTDLKSHQRGYPALLGITGGGPVGALVFARNAVAGQIWTSGGIVELNSMTVVGLNHRRLYPSLQTANGVCPLSHHRQSLLLGEAGQTVLAKAKIGIIGLGGVGSLVSHWVSMLGVGEIRGVDFDRYETTNRSRVVGARWWHSLDFLRDSRFSVLRRLGDSLAAYKVRIARKVAKRINPRLKYREIVGNVVDVAVAKQLRDVDYLFLCADSMQSRLVFNSLVHQYLIPGVQIGSKVPVDPDSGELGNVFSVARLVMPEPGGGCLLCNQLIPASKLQEEALSPEERRQQQYIPDVPAPSVITLNAVGASQAVNDFLFSFVGLLDPKRARHGYRVHNARTRTWQSVDCAFEASCHHCGQGPTSVYGGGDRRELPCREVRT